MTPHKAVVGVWADLAAVREVQEAFGLEGLEKPEEHLWAKAYGVMLQHLDGGPGYAGPLYMLRGKEGGVEQTSLLLIRMGGEFVAVRDDQDIGECRPPICDGESLLFSDGEEMACGTPACPNYLRWR